MRIEVTREEQVFREEVRDWLHDNVPKEKRPTEGDRDGLAMREYDLAWQKKLYEGGWAGISWPKQHGGRGLTLDEMMIWHEETARAHAPSAGCHFVGLNHAGPTLISRGTPEQIAFHLPKILKGDLIWCQGFSEPGAGSDLASLSTRAEIDGDHLVVNGSKIWTSYAMLATYQELLVRTDPTAPKHKGISWVICDMRLPGIEIRPIPTMTGPNDHHFGQVFYTDVRIPLSNVVGQINEGWSVANTTLGHERGTGMIAGQIHQSQSLEDLIDEARKPAPDGGPPLIEDQYYASQLAMMRAETAAVRAMSYASIANARHNTPGPEASLLRMFSTEAQQRVPRLAMEMLGPSVLEHDSKWSRHFLGSFAATIAAGTIDIQRNIVGERILGLPRGPKTS